MIEYCKNGCSKPPHWTQYEFDKYYRSLSNKELKEIHEENVNNEIEEKNEFI
jgi:hypothetical protein